MLKRIRKLFFHRWFEGGFSQSSKQKSIPAGETYYVDAMAGKDHYSGKSKRRPWKTLAKVNETTFQPGDKILFRANGVWTGQLWPKGSGEVGAPIIIDRYGEGRKPLIQGEGKAGFVADEHPEQTVNATLYLSFFRQKTPSSMM